jgi:hypothetical protein
VSIQIPVLIRHLCNLKRCSERADRQPDRDINSRLLLVGERCYASTVGVCVTECHSVSIRMCDYRRPLREPLVPMLPIVPWRRPPPMAIGFDRAMSALPESARADGIDVKLVSAWTPIDPFAGL